MVIRLAFSLTTAPAGMLIDSRGVVTWVPNSSQLGAQPVSLQVSDGRGGTAEQDFSIEVRTQLDNQSPVITSRPSERATLGQPYVYDVQAADPDGDPLRFLLDDQPTGMVIDPQTGALRWTPATDQLGPTTVSIRVMDPFGGEATQSYVVNVRGTNTPPLITTSPPTEAAVGETYVYVVGAGAAEGDILTFSLPDAPVGMSIDAQAGVIDWTPEADQLGTHTVTLQVANAWGGSSSQRYEILVQDGLPNRPPAVTSLPPRIATVDQLYQYSVEATDPEAQPIEFGLRQSPVGMTIDASSGLLAWTPTAVQVGDHVVTIAALDAAGAAGLQSFTLTSSRPIRLRRSSLTRSHKARPGPSIATTSPPWTTNMIPCRSS